LSKAVAYILQCGLLKVKLAREFDLRCAPFILLCCNSASAGQTGSGSNSNTAYWNIILIQNIITSYRISRQHPEPHVVVPPPTNHFWRTLSAIERFICLPVCTHVISHEIGVNTPIMKHTNHENDYNCKCWARGLNINIIVKWIITKMNIG